MSTSTTSPLSPIHALEQRVEQLGPTKLLVFTSFCTQASLANIDHYLEVVQHTERPLLNNWMENWFWKQLERREISFSENIEKLIEDLLALFSDLENFPEEKQISPAPSAVMVREAIFLFLKNSEFFAGKCNIVQLLTCVNNCISCKIEYYYDETLGIDIRKLVSNELDEVYSFPIYSHAIADLAWVLDLLESDPNEQVSNNVLSAVKLYAKSCDTFVVRRGIYPQ